ncbi:MAG: hypothetical protein J0J15_19970, partial [Mesorhizobium sp.]|nr:hypothetical protein [Mesorhizobium sp.]
ARHHGHAVAELTRLDPAGFAIDNLVAARAGWDYGNNKTGVSCQAPKPARSRPVLATAELARLRRKPPTMP